MKTNVWHIQKYLSIYYLNEIKMTAGSQKSIHLLFMPGTDQQQVFSVIPYIKGQGQCLYLENVENYMKSCTLLPGLYKFLQRRFIQLSCVFSQGFANTGLLKLMTDPCFLFSVPVASQCLLFIPLFTGKDADQRT